MDTHMLNSRRGRGQAMTEFALLLPIMLMLVLGIFEFGRAFYYYSALANAAREGARYGLTHATDTNGIKSAVVSNAIGVGIGPDDVTVQCVSACVVGAQIRVSTTYMFTSVAPLIPSFTMLRTASMRIESP